MLAGGLGLTLLAACGSEPRLPTAEYSARARALCGDATSALSRLPDPGPNTEDPLPNLVRGLLQWGRDTSVIVLVTPTATVDDVADIRRMVTGSREVLRSRYLDQSAAKAQFDTIFAGSELVDRVQGADLPASFTVVVKRGADVDGLVARFSDHAAVQSVRTARESLVPLVRNVRAFASGAATVREREVKALDELHPPPARAAAFDAVVEMLRIEATGLRDADRAAGARDHRAAARLVAAAAGRTSGLATAASTAGVPACGRSAWPALVGTHA
jgi:hypothetical protein